MQVTSAYGKHLELLQNADLPLATHRADEVVLAAGSRTGRLLVLKEGAVAIVRLTLRAKFKFVSF